MNVDKGKESFSEAEIAELRNRLLLFQEVHNLTGRALADRVGIPTGTLSQWLPNKYQGDNSNVAAKVNKFFLSEEASRQVELDAPETPDFQPTPTSRQIMGQFHWARRGNMVAVCGRPGVGKTSAARQFVAATPNAWLVTASPDTRTATGILTQVLTELGDARTAWGGGGGLRAMAVETAKRLKVPGATLIVDEAQFLEDIALEQLRSMHDRTGCGIALVGNPRVLQRLQGGARDADFAQFSSRLSLRSFYEKPKDGDVEIMLDAWGVKAEPERAFLSKIAAGPGALRSFGKVLELAGLIASQEGEARGMEHLQGAYAQHRHNPAVM